MKSKDNLCSLSLSGDTDIPKKSGLPGLNLHGEASWSGGGSRHLALSPEIKPAVLVEGVISEVLPTFGLIHVLTQDGDVLGINRKTPGVDFNALHEGQRLRCEVAPQFSRVLKAELLA